MDCKLWRRAAAALLMIMMLCPMFTAGAESPAETTEKPAPAVTHTPAELQRDVRAVYGGGIDAQRPFLRGPLHAGAQMAERVDGDMHVFDIRKVFNDAGRFAEQRRGDNRDRRILPAADAHGTLQALSACDQHSFLRHDSPSLPEI